jgi:hypothetical protein
MQTVPEQADQGVLWFTAPDDAPAAALYIDLFIEVHEALVVHSVPVKRLSVSGPNSSQPLFV